MTRLTNDIRAAISRSLVAHRFQAEVEAVSAGYAALAALAYDEIYNTETRAKMDALPEGWLPTADSISANISGKRVRFYFSGYFSEDAVNQSGVLVARASVVSKRMLAKHDRCDLFTFVGGGNVDLMHSQVWSQHVRLATSIKETRAQIEGALGSVSTINKLILVWPEVEPFAKKWIEEGGKSKLPAIPVSSLNAAIGLPVDGDAQ